MRTTLGVTVNLDRREAYVDGDCLPVVRAYDEGGDDCDLAEAVACTAGPDAHGLWVQIDLHGKLVPQ